MARPAKNKKALRSRKRTKRKVTHEDRHRRVLSLGVDVLKGDSFGKRDMILTALGYECYGRYLRSTLWRTIRKKAFQVHGRVCRLCAGEAEVIHHDRYSYHVLVGRDLRSLVPLCRDCHEGIEFENGAKLTVNETRKKYRETAKRCGTYFPAE